MLPGNPRYQPKVLQEHFGYDNLFRTVGRVEIASLQVMAAMGLMPASTLALLTQKVECNILALTTTAIEETERKITKHDIRAWIYEAQKLVPPELGRWLHIMLTSYDPLDTGRMLQYTEAHRDAVAPACRKLLETMIQLVRKMPTNSRLAAHTDSTLYRLPSASGLPPSFTGCSTISRRCNCTPLNWSARFPVRSAPITHRWAWGQIR